MEATIKQTREERAENIVQQNRRIVKLGDSYLVPSETHPDHYYTVKKQGGCLVCSCPDFQKHGSANPNGNGEPTGTLFFCKHAHALRLAHQRNQVQILVEKSPTAVLLEHPFADTLIKKRDDGLSYIDGASVVQRLNDSLGYDGWSFEILEQKKYDDECVTRGRLTVYGAQHTVVREHWGSHTMPMKRNSNEPAMSLGDHFKASATDALKRSAVTLGIGLALYSDEFQSFRSGL